MSLVKERNSQARLAVSFFLSSLLGCVHIASIFPSLTKCCNSIYQAEGEFVINYLALLKADELDGGCWICCAGRAKAVFLI